MAVIAALAYGGSFVVRGVTTALQDAARVVRLEVLPAAPMLSAAVELRR